MIGYPRPLRRGPIEAPSLSPGASGTAYPRPLRRGPIEAPQAVSVAGAPYPIRDRYVAAPLKLIRIGLRALGLPSIRDRYVAAPLKRDDLGLRVVRVVPYPRPLRRGPIEAGLPNPSVANMTIYPRPLRRGPIEAILQRLVTTCHGTIRDRYVAAPLKRRGFSVSCATLDLSATVTSRPH